MRLVFFGSSPFGLPTLERLASEHDVAAVVSQPDRPAGRSRRRSPTPIAAYAAESMAGVAIHRPQSCNTPAFIDSVRALAADAWVVIAYGQKLSRDLLAGQTAINLHASILPRHRGAAPINAAVLAGDPEAGNSVIALAERMDAGDVYRTSRMPIGPADTAADLHDRLAAVGADDIAAVLSDIDRGAAEPWPQDHRRATLAPKLSPSDAWIDLRASADEARRRVNALQPKPGVNATIAGYEVKLRRADIVSSEHGAGPGTLVDPLDGLVACADGDRALKVLELQPLNSRTMTWASFVAGRAPSAGDPVRSETPG